MHIPRALSIAGSDSGGGAGIQADLKTFHQHAVYGMTAITAVTSQNTLGVSGYEALSPRLVSDQIRDCVTDIGCDAAKTGMLASSNIISAVCASIREYHIPNLVVDPVMAAKGGARLLASEAEQTLIRELVPLAALITPNIPEAEILSGISIPVSGPSALAGMKEAALRIHQLGARSVLLKGGHLDAGMPAIDIHFDGSEYTVLESDRKPGGHRHGTGCSLSAAITANLALGHDMLSSIRRARAWLTAAIANAPRIGGGIGPVNHLESVSVGI